jgi:flagellar basal-body rod modification protein FlgD
MDVNSLQAATLNRTVTTQTGKGANSLGAQDFLKLLTVQLQNQDPLKPMEDTDFIAQMANFSSLETMSELNTNFASFSQSAQQSAAQTYLGKQVTLTDPNDGQTLSGIATAVSRGEKDNLFVTVEGREFSLSAIKRVEIPATNTEPAPQNP